MIVFAIVVGLFLTLLFYLVYQIYQRSQRKKYKSVHNSEAVMEHNREHLETRKYVSDHHKFRVPSKELDDYRTSLLLLLSDWHEYCNAHSITYAVVGGSVIGYYCHGEFLPWDDDIDVAVPQNDEALVLALWESGRKNVVWKPTSGNSDWAFKTVEADPLKCRMAKHRTKEGWFKILPQEETSQSSWVPFARAGEVGGIDVNVAVPGKKGLWYEKPFPKNVTCDMNKLELVDLHGQQVWMPNQANAQRYLDKRYGKQWRNDIMKR